MPFVKVGGHFVALKGKTFREELDESRAAIKILGGGAVVVREVILPKLADKRAVITIAKKNSTPKKFPRRAGVPNKQPL